MSQKPDYQRLIMAFLNCVPGLGLEKDFYTFYQSHKKLLGPLVQEAFGGISMKDLFLFIEKGCKGNLGLALMTAAWARLAHDHGKIIILDLNAKPKSSVEKHLIDLGRRVREDRLLKAYGDRRMRKFRAKKKSRVVHKRRRRQIKEAAPQTKIKMSRTEKVLTKHLGAPLTAEKLEKAIRDAGDVRILATQLGRYIHSKSIVELLKQLRKETTAKVEPKKLTSRSGPGGQVSLRQMLETELGTVPTAKNANSFIQELGGVKKAAAYFSRKYGRRISIGLIYTTLSLLRRKGNDAKKMRGSAPPA